MVAQLTSSVGFCLSGLQTNTLSSTSHVPEMAETFEMCPRLTSFPTCCLKASYPCTNTPQHLCRAQVCKLPLPEQTENAVSFCYISYWTYLLGKSLACNKCEVTKSYFRQRSLQSPLIFQRQKGSRKPPEWVAHTNALLHPGMPAHRCKQDIYLFGGNKIHACTYSSFLFLLGGANKSWAFLFVRIFLECAHTTCACHMNFMASNTLYFLY